MTAPAYFSDRGPPDGPYPHDRLGAAIGVYADPSCPIPPVGVALHCGKVAGRREGEWVGVYRLAVGKADVEGLWVVRGRRFVRLGEAAEVVG